MDRATVYTQEQGRSIDFLFAQRATMIGLGKLSQAAFGSGIVVRGLAVTPNSPAALNVLVGIGEIYAMTAVDATTWGSLGSDTTDMILKQGLNMTAQTISTPAPSTSGYSIAYLIEAQYQDQDTNPAVLPFYNSANAQQPLNGQGGSGASLPTQRQGLCVIQAKAGIAATTGSQTTPSVDSGWTALAVVTVANGQTTVTSGNISVPAGVPQITSLLQMMQTGSPGYAVDSSTTPNQISLALTPTITSYTDGQEVTFKAANTNTGPCTINAGGGSVALVGVAGALQGGEIVAGSQYTALYSASLGELVLNSQTGGAEQINPATQPKHAVQFGQIQTQSGTAFAATGTAPAYALTPSPAISAYAANQRFRVAFAANGTLGSNTLNVSALGAKSLMQYDGAGNLIPATIVAGMLTDVEYNGTYMVVLDPLATASGVVGGVRNLAASLAAAGTSITFTADEFVAKTALGGGSYLASNFSKTLSTTATGAGGMDTGSAPASGYLAIYGIYNPTSNAWALLGTNATNAAVGNVYGGANMPSGYTASALLAVWPTNASSQLVAAFQIDRAFTYLNGVSALSSNTAAASVTSLNISGSVPLNAKTASGTLLVGTTATTAGSGNLYLFPFSTSSSAYVALVGMVSSAASAETNFSGLPLTTAQRMFYECSGPTTPLFQIAIAGYTI